ncbi:low-specificity L-threonine aldolase [Rheinheimera texasensis]|uniref:low-specificity L-threonine aldolase n=1 Tax=Rheinheimera texasensis TaxID=306205 RepID=UPI0032B12F1D
MIDFRSDTVTQPTAAMRAAMAAAPLGDDVFGDDPSVNALQQYAAELLGFEAALFAPSGTMTNLIALMSHCQRGDEAIVGQNWHTYKWEGGGMAVLGSIQPQPLANQPDGSLLAADVLAAIKPDDPHFARTRLLVIENTTGGQVLSLDYMAQMAALAKANQLACHIDGARIFNAAVAIATKTQADPYQVARQLVSGYDSISVCLSKGLGAPVGSLLLGSAEFIARARRVRKMLGGGMRQAGGLAAAGLYALQQHVRRLADDHQHAQQLASGLKQIVSDCGLETQFSLQMPQTNIIFCDLDAALANHFVAELGKHQVRLTSSVYQSAGQTKSRLRLVTHLDITLPQIQAMLSCSRDILSNY